MQLDRRVNIPVGGDATTRTGPCAIPEPKTLVDIPTTWTRALLALGKPAVDFGRSRSIPLGLVAQRGEELAQRQGLTRPAPTDDGRAFPAPTTDPHPLVLAAEPCGDFGPATPTNVGAAKMGPGQPGSGLVPLPAARRPCPLGQEIAGRRPDSRLGRLRLAGNGPLTQFPPAKRPPLRWRPQDLLPRRQRDQSLDDPIDPNHTGPRTLAVVGNRE